MITAGNQTTGLLRNYIEPSAYRQFLKAVYLYEGGEKKTLKTGDRIYTMNVPQRTSFSVAQATLTEGITPSESGFVYDQVAVTCTQYGVYARVTDVADKDSVFDLYVETAFELSRQMAEVADQVIQNELLANGTYVAYAAGRTTRATLTATDYLKNSDLTVSYSLLRGKSAPFADGNGYIGVFHPFVIHDLKSDTTVNGGFSDLVKYAMPEKVLNGEIAKMNGVRIVESPNIATFLGGVGGTVKIYPSFVFGKYAYAVVESQPMETIIKSSTSGGPENPLNLAGSVAVKIRFGVKILKQESLVRLESTSSLASQTLPY